MKILKTRFKKLNLSKKILSVFVAVVLLILGFGFALTKKLPPEAKFLINHLE